MARTERMTIEQLRELNNSMNVKKGGRHNNEEHQLQVECVNWFRCTYPSLEYVLFAVPNGGQRSAKTAADLKAEGVLAGVADLILLKSNRYYGYMAIEMKTPKGRQQESQKAFEDAVNKSGGIYKLVRSLEQFKSVIKEYLENE